MSPAEHHKFTRFAPFIVMGLVALVGGTFFTVLNSQQNQDNRSRASITTGTYVGTLTGDGKIIGGSVTEDIIGSNNTVGGSVGGCIKGNNNIVGGIVAGTVSGTGNVIAGGSGNGPCLSSGSTTSTNLVSNGGFESGTTGWQFNKRGTGAGTFTTTTSSPKEGANAAEINVTASSTEAYHVEIAQYGKPMTAGKTYTVSFWAKASFSRPMDVVVQNANSPYTEYLRKNVAVTTAWQQYTQTFTASQTQANTFVGLQFAKATGKVWVDDVQYYTGTSVNPSPTNTSLVKNPGCEANTTNWTGWQGTLSRVTSVARTGAASCFVTRTTGTAYTMDDNPDSVPYPKQGETYTASAWVRSTTAVGKPAYLSLRVWGGATSMKSTYGPPTYLSTNWQKVTNTMTVDRSDRTSLDIYIAQESAVSGNSFYADDIELYKGSSPVPTIAQPTPTPTKAVTPTPTKPAPTATPVPGVTKVSVSPASVSANGTLTVTWSGVNNPTVKDWIGLMSSNTNLDANPWVYTSSCSQAAAGTTAKSSGTCSLKAPSASGAYTVKLLENDTFVQLASGNTITVVSSQPTPTPSGDTQAPTAPTNLRSTSITSAAVKLAWNASTDAVGVTQYNISRGNEAGTNYDYNDSVSGSTLTFTDTNVQAGIIYKYRVRAKDAAGNLSDFSNVITVGVPTAPLPTPRPTIVVDPFPTATPQPTSTPAPTMTPVPGGTSINLNLALHGIGKGGDSANPTGTGNTTPLRPQRTVAVEVFDSANAVVKTLTGTVSYDTASGHFKGLVSLGTGISSGSYSVRVKTDQLLRTVVPGIQNLVSGETYNAPLTAMVTGDINNDNQLNILDYNILMGCYSDLSPAINCPAGDELRADITDDGDVNQFDYNLFLRELINRGGQ